MTEPTQAQRAESLAIEARTLINQHLVECTRNGANMAISIREMREDTASSIRRLHERMDENFRVRQQQFEQTYRDNKLLLVTLLIFGAGSIGSGAWNIINHFWK